MLRDRVRHFCQPSAVVAGCQNIGRGKKFNAVGGGIAQGLEHPVGDQHRHVMRLAVQYPSHFFGQQPRRKFAMQGEELFLIVFHALHD